MRFPKPFFLATIGLTVLFSMGISQGSGRRYVAPQAVDIYRGDYGDYVPGSSHLYLSASNRGKVRGGTGLILKAPPYSLSSDYVEYHSFQGRVIGKPVQRLFADPDDLVDHGQGFVVPSSYEAHIRVRSAGGIVITGVLQTSIARSTKPSPGYPMYRTHMRFHGTISRPSILGITKKRFTLTRTLYRTINGSGS